MNPRPFAPGDRVSTPLGRATFAKVTNGVWCDVTPDGSAVPRSVRIAEISHLEPERPEAPRFRVGDVVRTTWTDGEYRLEKQDVLPGSWRLRRIDGLASIVNATGCNLTLLRRPLQDGDRLAHSLASGGQTFVLGEDPASAWQAMGWTHADGTPVDVPEAPAAAVDPRARETEPAPSLPSDVELTPLVVAMPMVEWFDALPPEQRAQCDRAAMEGKRLGAGRAATLKTALALFETDQAVRAFVVERAELPNLALSALVDGSPEHDRYRDAVMTAWKRSEPAGAKVRSIRRAIAFLAAFAPLRVPR